MHAYALVFMALILAAAPPPQTGTPKPYGPSVAQLCKHPTASFSKTLAYLRSHGVFLCKNPQQAKAAIARMQAHATQPPPKLHRMTPKRPAKQRPKVKAKALDPSTAIRFTEPSGTVHRVVRTRCAPSACHALVARTLRAQIGASSGFIAHFPPHLPHLPKVSAAPTAVPIQVTAVNDQLDDPSAVPVVGWWGCGTTPAMCQDSVFGNNLYVAGHTPQVYVTIPCFNGAVGGYATQVQADPGGSRLDFTLPSLPVPAGTYNGDSWIPAQLTVSNGESETPPINVQYFVRSQETDLWAQVTDAPAVVPMQVPSGYAPETFPDLGSGNDYLAYKNDKRAGSIFGGYGDDVIGENTQILNGFIYMNVYDPDPQDGYQAVWINAWDTVAGINGDPGQDYGANVTSGPPANSLQVGVRYFYGGGHGVEYNLMWALYGPYGLRPVNTMPYQQGGVCER